MFVCYFFFWLLFGVCAFGGVVLFIYLLYVFVMMSNFEHLYHNLFSIEIFYSVQGNPCCAGSYWNEERSICESKNTFILGNMYKKFIFLQQNQKNGFLGYVSFIRMSYWLRRNRLLRTLHFP